MSETFLTNGFLYDAYLNHFHCLDCSFVTFRRYAGTGILYYEHLCVFTERLCNRHVAYYAYSR